MAKDNEGFPFKENAGTSKEDLERGFTPDVPEEEVPEYERLYHHTEGPMKSGGFLGRAKGWER